MTKIKAAIAGILALFAIAPAIAQQFPTVPYHTVIGRIGSTPGDTGPSQAIPFATLQAQMGIPTMPAVYATTFGVKCDGTTNDSPAAQLAVTAAAGRPVIFPGGTCIMNSSVTYNTVSTDVFTQGLQIIGQGREKTIFDWRGTGYLFASDTSVDFKFQVGTLFKDFKITTTTFPATSNGIRVHRTAYAKFDNIQITGLTGDGIDIPASVGDADAAFIIELDRVRMDNIAGWCGNFNAPSGGYFGSNLRIVNSTFQGCGTLGVAVPPTSGAVQYKGLIAQIVNSGFTINNNVDLYVQGPDSSVQITIDGVDFENHKSTVLPHVYVDAGLRGFHMLNSECLNNDSFVGQGCVWFNSATGIIGDVTLDKVQVRATSGNNPYVAFKQTGGNTTVDTLRVRNVYWQTFDGTGQTRFSGFQFDGISGAAQFSISALNTARLIPTGLGATMPMKLAATGEWVEYHVPVAGITKTGIGGGSPGVQQYFYLFNSAATNLPLVGTVEMSALVPVLDAEGYFVKTGDSTRTYIGTATPDGSANFQTTSTQVSQYPSGGGASVGNSVSGNIAVYTGASTIGGTATGTGVLTALGINVGSAGALVTNGGALGSPSSVGTLPAHTLGGTIAGGGNQINNVIIGTTTPLAGSFTTLNATGSVTSTAANQFFGPGGTGTTNGQIVLDGGSGANAGPIMNFRRNAVALHSFGTSSAILGGASNDFVVYSIVSGGAIPSINVSSATGALTTATNFGTKAPVTTSGSYTVLVTDSTLICSAACTLTLQAAATYPGRFLWVKTTTAAAVISASSNVVPRTGGAATTAILPATAGAWALLQSDGTNWILMTGTP